MKLLSKEPTPEMLSIISNEKEVFHSAESLYAALYDAAPEADVQAELAKREARIAELEEDKATLVRNCNQSFDAMQGQQETIEKQAARIKELEHILAPIQEASDKAEAAGRKALEWVDYAKKLEVDSGAVGVENQRLRSKVTDQAAEISRLKGVIAKFEAITTKGPVAEFGGLRLTPEGTNEFWGWTIGDSADVLVSGMKLYRLPEGD